MDDVSTIKERVNIVDVVGEYVKLTKAGRNYKGLSPFKKEKTPSFFVSPDKNMYYDFSSNKGGDVFSFLQEVEGVDFRGALTMLAERAGITLSNNSTSGAQKDEKDALYAAMEQACAFFETKFQENTEAQAYLTNRGITLATARRFRIGYAPESWHTLRDHLTAMGIDTRIQEKVGLIKKAEQGANTYDRFRSRIMFPIGDSSGRVVAFSGRVIGEAAQDEHNAKYLNSPESPLFDKSAVLYGYDKAKQPMRQHDFAIVVEGQMDIVMAHQAGYTNTVATSGTALTSTHLALIARLTKNVAFAFDADSAGIAAVERAAHLALRAGMEVKVVSVPLGKDPADCIKENVDAWKTAVRDARSVVDFLLLHIDKQQYSEAKRAATVRDTVLPLIAAIQSGITRGFYVRNVAEHLGLAEHAVWEDVATAARHIPGENSDTFAPQQHGALLDSDETTTKEQGTLLSPKALIARDIAAILFWQEGCDDAMRTLQEEDVRTLSSNVDVSLEGMLAQHTAEKDTLAVRGELLATEAHSTPLELFSELLRSYAKLTCEEVQVTLRAAIRKAEYEQNEEQLDILLKELQELQLRITALAEQG
jgi:DNA primase